MYSGSSETKPTICAAGHDEDHERGLGELLAHAHDDPVWNSHAERVHMQTATVGPQSRVGSIHKLGIELFRHIEERWNSADLVKNGKRHRHA